MRLRFAGSVLVALLPTVVALHAHQMETAASGPAARRRAEAELQAGKTAYDRVCSVCHGMEGRGDAGPGPGLVPFEREYSELLAIVREGSGEMPPIAKERVSDETVQQIFEYLKSLNAAAPDGRR